MRIALLAILLVACRNEPSLPNPPAVDPPRTQFITHLDRIPPKDATQIDHHTLVKVIRAGNGPIVGKPGPLFSGYAHTFYSDDGYDTGTALEMKTWDKTNAYERRILSGRKAGDVVRVWSCEERRKKGQCTVFDEHVFGPLASK